MLQALYFCRPFREKVLQYKHQVKSIKKETLLTCLADLFYSVATQKKKVGTLAPKKFITRLRKENGMLLLKCFCIENFLGKLNPAWNECIDDVNYIFEKSFYFIFRIIWQLYAARCSWVPQLSAQHSGRLTHW